MPTTLDRRHDKSQVNQWLPWLQTASHRLQAIHIPKAMTTIKSKLLHTLATRSAQAKADAKNGFTLIELLVVVAIVGILSAVALPQFFGQTKKAAPTEGTQQASAIAKQASAYYLENGGVASGDTHTSCSAYAGAIKTDNTKFTYGCSGTKDAFKVIATGKDSNDNTKGVTVTVTSNLTDGTFSKPVVAGV